MPYYPEVWSTKTNKIITAFGQINTNECIWIGDSRLAIPTIRTLTVFDMDRKVSMYEMGKGEHYVMAISDKRFVRYKNGEWQLLDIMTGNVIHVVKNTLFKHKTLDEYYKEHGLK